MEEEEIPVEAARSARLPLIVLGVLLLLALIAAFSFYSNWRDTEQRAIAAETNAANYEKDSFRVSNVLQKTKADREAVADAAYKPVVMRGTAKAPGAIGVLFYNASTREVLLDINRLPEPPPGQQYQLWALGGASPTDAGLVKPENMNEGLMKMSPAGGATSFILTLEKAGGGGSAPSTGETYLSGSL